MKQESSHSWIVCTNQYSAKSIWSDGTLTLLSGEIAINIQGIEKCVVGKFYELDNDKNPQSLILSSNQWQAPRNFECIQNPLEIPEEILEKENTEEKFIMFRPRKGGTLHAKRPNARIYNDGSLVNKESHFVDTGNFHLFKVGQHAGLYLKNGKLFVVEMKNGEYECVRRLHDRDNETLSDKESSNDMVAQKNDKDSKEPPGGDFKNVSVQYVDDPSQQHIMLPMINGKRMTYDQALYWISKIKEEDEKVFTFTYKFKGWFPFDAMWALYRAAVKVFGFVHIQEFNWRTPPVMITIQTGYDQHQQIPWGPMEIMGISAPLKPMIVLDNGIPTLMITSTIKNSDRFTCDNIMVLAEKMLSESSIYRNKAIEVDFTIFNPDNFQFDIERAPRFMDTNVKESDLILSDDVFDQINVSILTPIRNTAMCREQKIPLRRSNLLAGKYGVGKTLTARVAARVCEENNWTFLYLKDLNQLPQALYFARKYQPCLVFAEDINRKMSGARTAEMDTLLNVIDGIDRKNDEVMTVFTTNNIEEIHPAMLRPGRMDSIITVTPPDAKAVERLVRLYGRKMVQENEDLTEVGKLLEGQIPAIIGEAVEKSKLAAIKDHVPGQPLVIRSEHLLIAGKTMLNHAKLLEPPAPPRPDIAILGDAIAETIVNGVRNMVNDGKVQDVPSMLIKKATSNIPSA